MILINTNVASEPTKSSPHPRVLDWFNQQEMSSIFISAISLAEMLNGVGRLPDGKRKESLRRVVGEVLSGFVTPVLPFDSVAAHKYAEVVALAKLKRYTLPVVDAQIAAIAAVHGFTVATRDVAPFRAAGVPVVNPWEGA